MSDHKPAEPHLDSPTTNRPRRWIVWASAGILIATLGIFAYRWWQPVQTVTPEPDITAPDPLDSDDPVPTGNPGYLGPEACVACHSTRVTTFLGTSHARACRRPENGPMPSG